MIVQANLFSNSNSFLPAAQEVGALLHGLRGLWVKIASVLSPVFLEIGHFSQTERNAQTVAACLAVLQTCVERDVRLTLVSRQS